MGRAGRNVEHVARLCMKTLPLLKVGEQFEIVVIPKRRSRVTHLTSAPQPLALDLYEEHVVIIKVGPDTSALGGIADHDIIESPRWECTKRIEKAGYLLAPGFNRLNQQCPALGA